MGSAFRKAETVCLEQRLGGTAKLQGCRFQFPVAAEACPTKVDQIARTFILTALLGQEMKEKLAA